VSSGRLDRTGWFPNFDWGIPDPTYNLRLKMGDTYKIGTAQLGYSRYSVAELAKLGVVMVPEFFGSKLQVEAVEKLKLMAYVMINKHLPPGNTKFQ
jgi:hypothetical protein